MSVKINYDRLKQKNEARKWLKENDLYDDMISNEEDYKNYFLKGKDYEYAVKRGYKG